MKSEDETQNRLCTLECLRPPTLRHGRHRRARRSDLAAPARAVPPAKMKVRRAPRITAHAHLNPFPPAEQLPEPPPPDATRPPTQRLGLSATSTPFSLRLDPARSLPPLLAPLRCAGDRGREPRGWQDRLRTPRPGRYPRVRASEPRPPGRRRDATARWVWGAAVRRNTSPITRRDPWQDRRGARMWPCPPRHRRRASGRETRRPHGPPGELDLPEQTRQRTARGYAVRRRCAWVTPRTPTRWARSTSSCVRTFYTDTELTLRGRSPPPCGRYVGTLAGTRLGCRRRWWRYLREKLEADRPFFDATETLFEDPTPRKVGGVAEEDEDLWFFEYTPK